MPYICIHMPLMDPQTENPFALSGSDRFGPSQTSFRLHADALLALQNLGIPWMMCSSSPTSMPIDLPRLIIFDILGGSPLNSENLRAKWHPPIHSPEVHSPVGGIIYLSYSNSLRKHWLLIFLENCTPKPVVQPMPMVH